MARTDRLRAIILQGLSLPAQLRLRRQARQLARMERGSLRRLLIIRPDHLGDLLFAGPAVRRLRVAFPQSELVLAVGPWSREVAGRVAEVDQLLTLSFAGFTRQAKGNWWQPYRTLWQTAKLLRKEQAQHGRYALALNLRFDFWWGALLCLLADIPSLGYATPLNRHFTTVPIPYQAGRHEVEQNLALVQAMIDRYATLPVHPTSPDPSFSVKASERAAVGTLLQQAGIGADEQLIIIHPGAGNVAKQWPIERWAVVARELLASGARVVITGGPGEQQLAAELARQTGTEQVLNLAGQTSLGQLATLLERANLVLGVDSGPLHLASTLGTPTLRLFGPSNATIWGPWPPHSPRHRLLKAANLAEITPADVLIIVKLLQSQAEVGSGGTFIA